MKSTSMSVAESKAGMFFTAAFNGADLRFASFTGSATGLLKSYIMQLAESEARGFPIAIFDLAGFTNSPWPLSCVTVSLESFIVLGAVSESLGLSVAFVDTTDIHGRILSGSSDIKEDSCDDPVITNRRVGLIFALNNIWHVSDTKLCKSQYAKCWTEN
jgi:hypothetical protein